MSLALTLSMIEKFLCFAVLLQSLELIWLCRSSSLLRVWSFKNLESDLNHGLPLPRRSISLLFGDSTLLWMALAQFLLAVAGFIAPHVFIFAGLLVLHLLIVIRFRGSFNGGSDMMIFVILTGIVIAASSAQEKIQQLGVFYIAIHAGYSYLKAGLVKIASREWRFGIALPSFLGRSLFLDIRKFSKWISAKPALCILACWGVIVFELGIVALPFVEGLPRLYFMAAIFFHLVIFLFLGLNRFVWAWMPAWFALSYMAVAF